MARIGFAGDAAVWVDEDGVVLSQADTAVLCGVAPTGNIVPREVVAAARAVERLDPGLLKQFPCFDASDLGNVVARSTTGSTVIECGPIGNLPSKVTMLNELWRNKDRAHLDLTAYGEIDLRWDDTVVLKPR